MTPRSPTADVHPVQAMLLAAGLGTRLRPLTEDRAKPAVPFLGKPLIRGLIELLAQHHILRAVVNTHHLPESIHEALAGASEETGVSISYSHETEILGTAGALSEALARHLLDPQEQTLIINAKLYTDLDLSAAAAAHHHSGGAVTMVLRPNQEREHFKEVLVENGRVIGFGKSRVPEGPSPLLFTGIHILEPEVLTAIPRGRSDTVVDIYPPLIARGRVAAHIDGRGRWWEFSTLERYLELHVREQNVVCSPGAVIEAGARVERSVLWENARVESGATVRDSILGRGVVVPKGAVVERTALARGQTVPIEGSIEGLNSG